MVAVDDHFLVFGGTVEDALDGLVVHVMRAGDMSGAVGTRIADVKEVGRWGLEVGEGVVYGYFVGLHGEMIAREPFIARGFRVLGMQCLLLRFSLGLGSKPPVD